MFIETPGQILLMVEGPNMESMAIFELLYQCGSEGSNHLSTWSSGNVPEKLHLVKEKVVKLLNHVDQKINLSLNTEDKENNI